MRIITHIIDITCSYTLLYIGNSLPKWMPLTKKVWNKRLHTSRIEKHRRIVLWNKWCWWDNRVIFRSKEIKIFLTKFRRGESLHEKNNNIVRLYQITQENQRKEHNKKPLRTEAEVEVVFYLKKWQSEIFPVSHFTTPKRVKHTQFVA